MRYTEFGLLLTPVFYLCDIWVHTAYFAPLSTYYGYTYDRFGQWYGRKPTDKSDHKYCQSTAMKTNQECQYTDWSDWFVCPGTNGYVFCLRKRTLKYL